MTFAEAKRTAVKLFGPGIRLHRGHLGNCYVIRDTKPIGDGRSWLEALRSAGEFQMLKNAYNDAEVVRVETMIKAFRAEHPDIDPSKQLTPEQLEVFDAFTEAYDRKMKQTSDVKL